MRYLAVRNWDKFQHYKGQEVPPWIKLHRVLLSDYDFLNLTEVNQARLMKLWLLAAALKNRIPHDPKWVAKRIGSRSVDLDLLITAGFLERVYSPPREPLELAEQKNLEKKKISKGSTSEVDVEHAITKLLQAVNTKDEREVSLLRGHAVRLPEGAVVKVAESVTGNGVRNRFAYALGALKDEARMRS